MQGISNGNLVAITGTVQSISIVFDEGTGRDRTSLVRLTTPTSIGQLSVEAKPVTRGAWGVEVSAPRHRVAGGDANVVFRLSVGFDDEHRTRSLVSDRVWYGAD